MEEKASTIEENSEIKIMDLANDMIENQHANFETPLVENNIELEITNAFSNDISHNKVNAVSNDISAAFKSEEPVSTNFDIELKVKDASEIIEDEIVTIKGITLNRRKGNRLLSDYELEQEANFEIQKRSFDERASKLRSLSFNFDNNENKVKTQDILLLTLEDNSF